ncbi:polysaccharide export protein EpsE [Piscinibacter gummiphilus]|uniref:Polysaccharide export protein EpsE n=1 Tax=Piscinibacter gummiphilus TaxID=946333 RepID=A0ABZ0CM00_9BURK|nr:polysaccharide export protein EpsE [Piscinibacter gummiphilus]WOB06007.1 polysaccharide export protein EpsE [Piscinibacter gummiphilus]
MSAAVMRRVLSVLCLVQALTLGACALNQAPSASAPLANDSIAKTPSTKAPAPSAKVKAAKAAEGKAAAAKAARQAKAEAARIAAAERAEAAKAAAAAKAEARARAEATARAEAAAKADALAKAAAAARAERVARAVAKARADAMAKADAAARADAEARAQAVARSEAADKAAATAKTASAKPVAPARPPEFVAAASPPATHAIAMPTSLVPRPTPAQPLPAEPRRDYAVAGGDVLRISVYQSPDLSLDARVSESGTISYPLLGQVSVGGLSIAQVEAAIARGLRDGHFLKRPQVGVLLLEVRGNQVSVLGMANRPGRYPIEVNGMLLSELLALAGGVAPGGSEVVTLSGIRNGQPFRQRVDINALFADGAESSNPMVHNGDTLYIDRLPSVYVYGEVQRPGAIPLTPDMTLMQAVASGGGLTQRGTERGLRVHRRDESGEVQVLNPAMDDVLKPGDVVYVRESLF